MSSVQVLLNAGMAPATIDELQLAGLGLGSACQARV